MNLNAFTASKKRAVFEDLQAGREPREGKYDPDLLREGRTKGRPQMGGAVYTSDEIRLEFIYPDPVQGSVVLTVAIPAPERIVAMPVPSWVVEHVWQGEVLGSFHFESDARRLLEEFRSLLEPVNNIAAFDVRWRGVRE
jgi:hypothetical protein